MLIVLEGLDGAGKSTQVRMLKEYLSGKGPLDYIHFPRYEAPVYGDLITRFLRGEFGNLESVHPQIVALLFAEDRHGAAPGIRAALDAGHNVLLDRYVYSNIAYQCAKMPFTPSASTAGDAQSTESLRRWIMDTEFGVFNEPRPDLNIFLDVPIGFVENNLTHAREGADRNYLGTGGSDIHEADIEFQKRVREMYLECARETPDLKVVDCCTKENSGAAASILTQEQIFEKIRALVDGVIDNDL